MIMVSCAVFQLLRHRAKSQETHIHIFVDGKCWNLTACLGQTLEGFQIQSQVVEHSWHESKKSTSHMPLTRMFCWSLL